MFRCEQTHRFLFALTWELKLMNWEDLKELRMFVFYVKNLQMLVFIEWAKEEKMSEILCTNLKLENVHQKLFPQWIHVKFSMLLTIFRKRPFLCLAPGAKLFSAHWLSHFLLVKIFSYNFQDPRMTNKKIELFLGDLKALLKLRKLQILISLHVQ